jgi:signal transduction histidine kinase
VSILRTHRDEILASWETQVGALLPFKGLDVTHLRDHLPDLLDQLDAWLERSEQKAGRPTDKPLPAASAHALDRLELGLDLKMLVYEYRLLRRAIFETDRGREIDHDALIAINDAIDQAIAEGVNLYARESRRRLEETRDRFIGIVCHDLRNPISAISTGAAQMLRGQDLSDRQAQTVRRILRTATRMGRVVANALDVARVRLGSGIALTPAPTDLGRICREAIDEMQLDGTGKQIVFEADGDLQGEWEEDRIARVVHNLLSNALKYSRGVVRLRLRAENGEVVLDVANDGPPIPESSLNAIFELLWTSDPKAGLGFGLFIVREIVLAHRGAVSVRSSASEGTTFTVRLPRRASTK